MKASEARKITATAVKKRELSDFELLWDKVIGGIKASATTRNRTFDYPKDEVTPELRKRLKANGYKVNDCHAPEDPEDMHYTQISW